MAAALEWDTAFFQDVGSQIEALKQVLKEVFILLSSLLCVSLSFSMGLWALEDS